MRYAHYKDSGIEWIGEIPQGWSISKIKHCCSIYTGNSISDDEKNNYVYKDNSIPYIATKDIEAETNKINYDNGLYIPIDSKAFNIAPKNSILLCIEGGSAGRKISYTEQDVCFVNKLCCFNHNMLNNSKFLYYILQSDMFLTDFNLKMTGLIGGVSQSAIKNIILAVPKFEEQKQIANYLDKKCEKIDRVVEIQKGIIERLKEYKQSVITEAVTKGLDKSVPLKDSGIEWIGEIPQGWELRRLKTTLNLRNEKVEYNNEKYIGLENIISGSGQYCLSEEFVVDGVSNRFYSGDILFGKLRPYLAKATIVEFEGVCSSEFLVMSNYRGDNRFLLYILLSYWFIDIVNSSTYGTKMPRASWNFIGNMQIAFPNFQEQQQIANYLDKKCAQIDKIIADKELMIEKLIEYKKSLIYECVTGKRKVV